MNSAAQTADWYIAERRKQNYAIAAIVFACLLVALFPRNERRLFAFPSTPLFAASISAPAQTPLRSAVFSPAVTRQPEADKVLPAMALEPEPEPDIFGDLTMPAWTIVDEPIRIDQPDMSTLSEMTRRDWMAERPATNFMRNTPLFFAGGVPEPATWLMMILGIGSIAYRFRAQRARRIRQRGRARWRRNLVPTA